MESRVGEGGSISVICLFSKPKPINEAGHASARVEDSGCGSSCLFVVAKLEPVRMTRGEINPGRRACVSKTDPDEASTR